MKCFLKLLPDTARPLCCVLCGDYPKWLSFDGVSLAMNKDKVLWDTVDTVHPRDAVPMLPVNVLKLIDRVLIADHKTRDMLEQFCTARVNKEVKPMTEAQFKTMQLRLLTYCPPLYDLLDELLKEEEAKTQPLRVFNYCFAGKWKEFLLLLAAATSTALILRPAIIPYVLHIVEHRKYTEAHHHHLSLYCPPLANLLSTLKEIPKTLCAVLQAMVGVVQKTFPTKVFVAMAPDLIPHLNISLQPKQDGPCSTILEFEHCKDVLKYIQKHNIPLKIDYNIARLKAEGKYTILPEPPPGLCGCKFHFPRHQVLQPVAGVDTAKPSSRQQWKDPHPPDAASESSTDPELIPCSKVETSGYCSKRHTAGLFVCSCIHGVAYGCHIMVEPEGRKDELKILYERMPQEVLDDPLHVLFDFNCQEAEYMLNRMPEKFSNIRLFIDRWHATNHKCASVFKLQSYPAYQELPSTGAESLNNFLQLMHSQTPYMTQDTYMEVVTGVMGLRNHFLNEYLMKLTKKYTTGEPK